MGREGEDGLDPDIDHVEWTWRWDSEWIENHTSGGYVYGYGYTSDEEDYGTDVKFLSTSAMSDAENGVSVETSSSISPYMSITPSEDGLEANLECEQPFGCPIILTCTVYDEMDNSVFAEIRLDYDSVLGSLGTLEDWVEVESEREIEDALETSCNIKLEADIECSVEIEHRTHLDLNGHTLSGEADVSKRARIENGKITSSKDGIIAEGDEKIEIMDVDIEAGETGVSANADVEISNCSVTATGSEGFAVWSEGGTMNATSCTITGDCGLAVLSGTATLSNATVSGKFFGVAMTDGIITLSNATVLGESCGVYITDGDCTISGGSISAPCGVYASSGTVTLNSSCSVTGSTSSGYYAVCSDGGTVNATSCTLTGYYGAYSIAGSIDIENCSVSGSSYGIYISGQDSEPIIQYNDFADCSVYTVYNSSSSRTVEAYWCYTGGNDNDAGYEDAEDRSVNVYCYPSYPESVTVSPDSSEIFTGGETQTTATASVALKNSKLSYESQTYYTPAYSWSSSDTKVATVTGSGKTATITSVGAGTCDIICTAYDANGNAAMTVTKQVVTSISISFGSDIIYTSNSTSTTATAAVTLNSGTYSGSCSWSTTSSYITVSGSGSSATVTANGKGTGAPDVTCSATVDGTTYSQSKDITVMTLVSSIYLSNDSALFYGNGTENRTSTVTASPSYNLSGQTYTGGYTWSTSSSSIISISSGTGSSITLTATGSGTATITCKADNDLVTQTLSVTVTKQQITSVSLGNPTNPTIYYGPTATTTTSNVSVSSLVANSGSISTSEATYSWSIYSGSSYVTLSNSSSVTATATSKASGGSATLRCTVTYNGSSLTSESSSSITVTAQAISSVKLTATDSTIYYMSETTEHQFTIVSATVSLNNGSFSTTYGSYSWTISSGTTYANIYADISSSETTPSVMVWSQSSRGTATVRCTATFNNSSAYGETTLTVEHPYTHAAIIQAGFIPNSGTTESLWFNASYTAMDKTAQTTVSGILSGLYTYYGTSQFTVSSVTLWVNSVGKYYALTKAKFSSSSSITLTGSSGVTVTLTTSNITVSGVSSSVDGTWSYTTSSSYETVTKN